jgi:CHAT domain-containing protein
MRIRGHRVLRSLLLVILCGFISAHASAAEQGTPDYIAAYQAGDIVGAAAQARAAAVAAPDPQTKSLILLNVAYICRRIDDFDCFSSAVFDLFAGLDQLPEPVRESFRARTSAYFLGLNLWLERTEDARRLAINLRTASTYYFDHQSYLVLQETLSDIAREAADYVGAREAASRLVGRLVLFPDMPAGERARYVASIVSLLTQSGDSEGAWRFAAAFDPYVLANMPAGMLESAFYLEATAYVSTTTGNFGDAVLRLRQAADIVRALRAPEERKQIWLATMSGTEATAALLADDTAAVAQAQQRDPMRARYAEILQRGRFDSAGEVYSVVVDTLIRRSLRQPVDVRFAPLFAQPFDFKLVGLEATYLEPFRLFAKGFIAGDQGADGFADVYAAARQRLVAANVRQRNAGDLFPMPDLADRIAIGLVIDALATRGPANADQQGFVLSAFDYLQRNPRQARSDALEFVSSLPTENDRRLAQSYLGLSARRISLEMGGVHDVLRGDPATEAQRAAAARLFETLGQAQSETRARLGASTITSASAPWGASDIGEVRAHMTAREAIVAGAMVFGDFYKLCVSKNAFQLVRVPGTQELSEAVRNEVRLLRAALTATHAPSEQLDSQYPARAAVHLRELLLGGLESCLTGVSHISYVPFADMADIPLQALLEEMPPSKGNGYDLASAKWLLHRYDFSYISCLREFAATARLGTRTRGAQPFLGVGDPVLAGTGNSGLSALGELPETAAELAAIRRMLPNAVVLTREEATETRVRAQPLGEFNILSFATHGVIKGEVDGIPQSGLVLAQPAAAQAAPEADGFLSATELAALPLNARLVVLSACNSANIDQSLFAPQVRGLAEALGIAGVPVVVASLWSVDSETTRDLMINFFAGLAATPSGAMATSFSQGVRDFLKAPSQPAFHHPRFWAAFVVLGAGNIGL